MQNQIHEMTGSVTLGVLHRYYIFTAEENFDLQEMTDSIEDSGLSMKHFVEEAHDELVRFKTIFEESAHAVLDGAPVDTTTGALDKLFTRNNDVALSPLEISCNRIAFDATSLTLNYCKQLDNNLEEEQKLFQKIYGEWPCSVQTRCILAPWLIEFDSGREAYLNAFVFLFANGMGFLKVELPVENVTFNVLALNPISSLVKNARPLHSEALECDSILGIAEQTMSSLSKTCETTFRLDTKNFDNLILADYDGQAENPLETDPLTKEFLFRISHSPVPPKNMGFYAEQAEELFEQRSLSYGTMASLLNPMGGCLTLISSQFKEFWPLSDNESHQNTSLNKIDEINTLRIANSQFEFAILVIMMHRTQNEQLLSKGLRNPKAYQSARIDYEARRMFLIELQSYCCATVRDQIAFFKNKMPYYLKQADLSEKNEAFAKILEIGKNKRRRQLEFFATTTGLLFAVSFALPSLRDTLGIIRKALPIDENLPIVSIDGISLAIWFALLVWIAAHAWRLRPTAEKVRTGNSKRPKDAIPVGRY